jgi:hypothetical protein
MKMMVISSICMEKGNELIRQGKLGAVIQSALDTIKPEAVYFAAKDGKRTVYMIVEMQDASQIPAIAEPLFLGLNATVEIQPIMLPQDLAKAMPAIEAAAKKFSA